MDKNLGVCILDLCSKAGTEVNDIKIETLMPISINNESKIKFGVSTRHYLVEIDMSKMKRAAEDQ